MPAKRKLRSTPPPKGLAAGERLNRERLSGGNLSCWGWVGTEVDNASGITKEHCLLACSLGRSNSKPFCPNKYSLKPREDEEVKASKPAEGELEDDGIIVISESENEDSICSKKRCRDNPNCLNYLGQEKWEDEDSARKAFFKSAGVDDNPTEDRRDPSLPVGLKNLGATCYANAFLQVWFQDLAFRSGVYQCQPSPESRQKFEDSPIFQLQVTFTAMQAGNQTVFNPVKLVESLQLRTSEQQDAQEFSKLFMSHLDSEFKKQANAALKSLIPSQFEGKLIYATVCQNCKSRSERESTFLELEVNLERGSKLEDRLSALLAPETLTGDNKYLCSYCESLEDATRFTELRSFPPVLHISLLRFVYDISTMARKKSKHAILFPPYIDMGQFLRPSGPADTDALGQSQLDSKTNKQLYELRGVLLHKGTSAYHGHYEAQVFDVTAKQWYQFNDEKVTNLHSFHSPKTMNGSFKAVDDSKSVRANKSKKANNRRRVYDSDEDEKPINDVPTDRYLSSRDAYMLIYARHEDTISSGQLNCSPPFSNEPLSLPQTSKSASNGHITGNAGSFPVIKPPQRALDVVKTMNDATNNECLKYAEREKEIQAKFDATRKMVLEIYRSWSLSSASEESVVVSRQALEKWLLQWFSANGESGALGSPTVDFKDERTLGELAPDRSQNEPSTDSTCTGMATPSLSISDQFRLPALRSIDNSQLLCCHGYLNPLDTTEMKRIRLGAYQNIITNSKCRFDPELTPSHICKRCVENEFLERLYQIEHPRLVARFDAVCDAESDFEGYWISKQWVKDWRSAKPKMHIRFRGDPPPDAPDFSRHVNCEHGGLSLNSTSRRRISNEGLLILRKLYPSWEPPTWDTELCPICDTLVHISKEDKLEMRKKAETEKALLKRLHEKNVFGRKALLNDIPCAVVSSSFIRSWRSWLLRPGDAHRPESVDNSHFVCEHEKLNFDPNNPTDFDDSVAIVTRIEWSILETLYHSGPLLAISSVNDLSEDLTHGAVITEFDVCATCCHKKRLDYDTARISILRLKPTDSIPPSSSILVPSGCGDSNSASDLTISSNGGIEDHNASVPSSEVSNATRQSKRIREGKSKNQRSTIKVKKATSVREIKISLQKDLSIPTIAQVLFYRGKELDDNAVTVADLEILDNDILYLKEIDEDAAILMSDKDDGPVKKKRKEGRAFGGTLLGGSPRAAPSTEIEEGADVIATTNGSSGLITCSACTFDNPLGVSSCVMCFQDLS